jgi:uncharacterized protein
MMMNVLTELREPVGTVSQFDAVEFNSIGEGVGVRNLRGTAELLRTGRGLLVTFEGTALVEVTCSRCLRETECEVSVTFEEEYVPSVDPVSGYRIRSGFEPDAFRISEDHTLDLREGIRQYLLMSEGAKPLCRTDCRGLCPDCGADLNDGTCACHEMDVAGGPMPQSPDIR